MPPRQPEVLIGRRYGRLVVIAETDPIIRSGSDAYFRRCRRLCCRCDCGSEKTLAVELLRTGKAVSCGCWRSEPTGTSIDRIDNDGNYGPGNCRWATIGEQARNRRNNRIVEYGCERLLLVEACARVGLRSSTVLDRIRLGWSADRALSTPVGA